MSISTGQSQLVLALQKLRSARERSHGQWDDSVRKNFESRHLEPVERYVQSSLVAMERMSVLLTKARADCQ